MRKAVGVAGNCAQLLAALRVPNNHAVSVVGACPASRAREEIAVCGKRDGTGMAMSNQILLELAGFGLPHLEPAEACGFKAPPLDVAPTAANVIKRLATHRQ